MLVLVFGFSGSGWWVIDFLVSERGEEKRKRGEEERREGEQWGRRDGNVRVGVDRR